MLVTVDVSPSLHGLQRITQDMQAARCGDALSMACGIAVNREIESPDHLDFFGCPKPRGALHIFVVLRIAVADNGLALREAGPVLV